MLWLSDEAPPRLLVTPLLVAINVIAFVLVALDGLSIMRGTSDVLLRWGALYGPPITQGEWWRLAAAMFLHANLLHLLFNMLALVQIGGVTERLFGRTAFAVLYTLSGLAGSVASVAWHPLGVGVGASGAIFGLFGGLLGFLLRHHAIIPRGELRSLGTGAIAVLAANTFYGFVAENVDLVAHFGGLVAGFVAGAALAHSSIPPTGAAVRRNAAVAAAGLLLIAVVAARIPVVDDLPAALERLAVLDRDSAAAVDSTIEKIASGDEKRDVAPAIERNVLAPWRSHQRVIAELRVPDSERDRVRGVLQYMDRRAEAWRLTAQAVQEGDLALVEKSHAMHREANQILARLTPDAPPPAPAGQRAGQGQADDGAAALQRAFEEARRVDVAALTAYNERIDDLRAGRLAPDTFADELEKQTLTPWQQQIDAVSRVQVRGTVHVPKAKALEYMRLRLEAWQLLVRGLRRRSPQLVQESTDAHAKAEAVLQEIAGRAASGAEGAD